MTPLLLSAWCISAVSTSLLHGFLFNSILKDIHFTSGFHSVYLISHRKNHLLLALVFLSGALPAQHQILLSLQMAPNITDSTLCIALSEDLSYHSDLWIEELNLFARIFLFYSNTVLCKTFSLTNATSSDPEHPGLREMLVWSHLLVVPVKYYIDR